MKDNKNRKRILNARERSRHFVIVVFVLTMLVLHFYFMDSVQVVSLIIAGILLFSMVLNVRISNKLREQNRKYEVLSQISNEYIYEYFIREKRLTVSDKFGELFNTPETIDEVIRILTEVLSEQATDNSNMIIRLPLPDGKTGAFKVINSSICNHHGRTEYIIGKLMDVSKDVAEKEELLVKSQTDGLTGLYNAETTKDLIIERIENKEAGDIDAFILMDCDGFKNINDTHGHLAGNKILKHVATNLKRTFRSTDILGRIGGDEFCMYIKGIPSIDFIREKCRQLSDLIKNADEEAHVSVSIGVVLITNKEPYEVLFKKADKALYQAKAKGKSQYVIWEE